MTPIQFPKSFAYVCPECGYIIDGLAYIMLKVFPTCTCGEDMENFERVELNETN